MKSWGTTLNKGYITLTLASFNLGHEGRSNLNNSNLNLGASIFSASLVVAR
jgi:hypothetical protein